MLKKIIKSFNWRPNGLERKVIDIIEKYELPYDYVGDGKVFIAGRVPDFIHNNGKKKIIEVFGNYWHKPEDVERRTRHFSKYGYECLVIWEKELYECPEEVINKIKAFTYR